MVETVSVREPWPADLRSDSVYKTSGLLMPPTRCTCPPFTSTSGSRWSTTSPPTTIWPWWNSASPSTLAEGFVLIELFDFTPYFQQYMYKGLHLTIEIKTSLPCRLWQMIIISAHHDFVIMKLSKPIDISGRSCFDKIVWVCAIFPTLNLRIISNTTVSQMCKLLPMW